MNNLIAKKEQFNKILIYILAFYFFYQPDLSLISPFLKNSILLVILNCLCLFLLRRELKRYYTENNIFINLVGLLCIFSLMTLVSTVINKYPIVNNLTSIIMCLKSFLFLFLMIMIDLNYKTKEEKIKFIINIGLIQTVCCLLMLIFPFFKEIANQLYIQNIPDYYHSPQFGITEARIYGIFGDYTFSSSIFMAFLATLSLYYYFIYKNNYYLLSSILILFSSMLNGRTGSYIFVLCTLLILAFNINVEKITRKIIFNFLCLIIVLISAIYIFRDTTYVRWILSGGEEVINLVSGNKVGTFDILLNEFIFFPSGIKLLLGYGSRVYGELGGSVVGKASDIGYINDIFRGGIIFIICYYGVILCLIKQLFYNIKDSVGVNKSILLIIVIFIVLLISNFKGEALAASSILFLFLYVVGISYSQNKYM